MERPMLIIRTVQTNMFLLRGMPLHFNVLLGTGGVPMEHATLVTRTVQWNMFLHLGIGFEYSVGNRGRSNGTCYADYLNGPMEHVPASWNVLVFQCSVGNRGRSNGTCYAAY